MLGSLVFFSQELAKAPASACTILQLTLKKPEEVDAKHSEPPLSATRAINPLPALHGGTLHDS
jgi:hypothetical protein